MLPTINIRKYNFLTTLIWASTTCGYNKSTERRKQCYDDDDDSEGSTNIADTMMIPLMLFSEQVTHALLISLSYLLNLAYY